MLKPGEKVPRFQCAGVDEKGQIREFSLDQLLEGRDFLVLYFYPRDQTPGCTTEACDFRDRWPQAGGRFLVVGVSPDSPASHQKFQAKQGLNFPLLSDPDHQLLEAYQAWGLKKLYGKESLGVIRSTCLIAKDGTLVRHWPKVKVAGHVEEVLAAMKP